MPEQEKYDDAASDEKPSDYLWEPSDIEIAHALELNTISTFRTQFKHLKKKFRSFREIYESSPEMMDVFPESSEVLKERFIRVRMNLEIGREFERVPAGVEIITFFDSRYPPGLKELYDPPPVLYVRGDIEFDFFSSLSIVGCRVHTDYGRQMAERFAYQLGCWGYTIISGGARGIDSMAHVAALNAGGGTIAVYGCGIDICFPQENKDLFDRIAGHGAIISEFPPGTIPEKYNFPARNRIIAGLSRGTLVVEAGEKSGALITSEFALQLGREVFAVPGRVIDSRSRGTNFLIRDGAHIVMEPSDIPLRFGQFVIVGDTNGPDKSEVNLQGDEAEIYSFISLSAREINEIVRESGLSAPRVLSALLTLQTKGLIKELPGGRYVRPVMPGKPPDSDHTIES